MNVLFIDDNKDSVEPLRDYFEKEGMIVEIIDFPEDEKEIVCKRPDCIVLDRMNGGVADDPEGIAGDDVIKKIRNHYFCPILIYSANSSEIIDTQHPLIEFVEKRSDTKREAFEKIINFKDFVQKRKNIISNIDIIAGEVLRDLLPLMNEKNAKNRIELFSYLANRRISASINSLPIENDKLQHPIVQYIYPCVGNYLLFGDVIRRKSKESYDRLVLTPSCDMVNSQKQPCKVKNILVAKIDRLDLDNLEGYNKPNKVTEKKVDSLVKYLNANPKLYFLPEIPTIIDNSIVKFKELELISTDKIYSDTPVWERIVSIDSPFREQLSWAFSKEIGRLGLPDRDFKTCARKILESAINEGN